MSGEVHQPESCIQAEAQLSEAVEARDNARIQREYYGRLSGNALRALTPDKARKVEEEHTEWAIQEHLEHLVSLEEHE